ncbi:hypothetical protein EDB85DRAFT_1901419 [Lactarius pseudohatsudake]|nr:hypothetical protein EDB85DRAFT_1901419 [Lactarius pseudohatsudake]
MKLGYDCLTVIRIRDYLHQPSDVLVLNKTNLNNADGIDKTREPAGQRSRSLISVSTLVNIPITDCSSDPSTIPRPSPSLQGLSPATLSKPSVEEPLQIIVRPVDEEVQAIPEPVEEPASPLVEGPSSPLEPLGLDFKIPLGTGNGWTLPSVSTASSISLGSDILDNRSLFGEPILEDVSTELFLLSTHRTTVSIPISLADIPLPRTPSLLSTPTATASVSSSVRPV